MATRQDRHFLRFFRHPFESAPFAEHLAALESRLREKEVRTEGMKVVGIMNGRLSLRPPADLVFDDCREVPVSRRDVA